MIKSVVYEINDDFYIENPYEYMYVVFKCIAWSNHCFTHTQINNVNQYFKSNEKYIKENALLLTRYATDEWYDNELSK